MKREFLEAFEVGGAKLPKDIMDAIMAENGKDIEAQKAAITEKDTKIAGLTTERDGLSAQIKERDKDIKTLREQAGNSETLNNQLKELQAKYDTDTTGLQQQLSDQALGHATEKFFGQFEFASELAKKAAISDFKEQKFKLDDKGVFQGGKEWVENLQKADPAAFKAKEQDPPPAEGEGQPQGNQPFFVGPTGNKAPAGGGNENPFAFNFSGVRPTPEKK